MAERVLVTGATGKVGQELIRLLLQDGVVVRAGTRDPERATHLFGQAVEVVELDYDATETYDAAVQWVDRIFLVPPPFDPDAYDTLLPLLDWAVASGTRQIVLLSAMDVEARPELALHRLETHLEELHISWTLLRPNLYMQNFTTGFLLDDIRERGQFALCAGSGRVSFVDVRDVAAVAAAALHGAQHDGQAYTLTGGAALDFAEVAALISEAAARAIAYRSVPPEQMTRILQGLHWPERQAAVGAALFASVAAGRREPTHGDIAEVLGRVPTGFQEFAREHAHVWR